LQAKFREDLAERRCLVLADGFYEWAKTPEGKAPYRFVRRDRARSRLPVSGRSARTQWGRSPLLLF
jgi:hypothetical protein